MIQHVRFHVGIDIAAEDFATSIFTLPDEPIVTKESISNSMDGFEDLLSWLKDHKVESTQSVICMEATGVYGEALCYFLVSKGYRVAVEPPLKVKRAFHPEGHKTDPVDSRQIAEYAHRFFDELQFWKPPEKTLAQLDQLLTTREQLTKQSTAIQCSLITFQRHVVKTPLVIKTHERTLKHLKKSIQAIDDEIEQLIRQNPTFRQMIQRLDTTPGVGIRLASNLMVLTQGFTEHLNPRQLAAYIGICPYKHRSGKSIRRKDRTRSYGPSVLRKLLHLAARSVCTHNQEFRKYYLRKLEEGKDKKLVYNNVANKLLKIMCAMINSDSPYIPNYKSVNPMFVQKIA